MNKLPVCMFAFDRLDYFERSLKAVVDNLDGRPLSIYLDKAPRDTGIVQDRHIEMAKDLCPEVRIKARKWHVGLGVNLIEAKLDAFRYYVGSHGIWFVEDDFEVSPGGFQFGENVLEWSQRQWTNIGLVSIHNEKNVQCMTMDNPDNMRESKWEDDRLENPQGREFQIESSWCNNVCVIHTRESFEEMQHMLIWYKNRFLLRTPYAMRNHEAIQRWRLAQTLSAEPQRGQSPLDLPKMRVNKQITSITTGQDAVTHTALFCCGFNRISPVLSRGLYFGKRGVHVNEQVWNQYEYDKCKSWHTSEDATNKEFEFYRVPGND